MAKNVHIDVYEFLRKSLILWSLASVKNNFSILDIYSIQIYNIIHKDEWGNSSHPSQNFDFWQTVSRKHYQIQIKEVLICKIQHTYDADF
jgi:hypothetical protein